MPAFFTQRRGKVMRVTGQQGGAPMPFQIKMEDISIKSGANSARAIITQAAIVRQGNFQFLHTVGEAIYAYVFGDRMDELRISGVAFSEVCDQEGTGMQQVLYDYEKNRIAATARPLLVNMGDATWWAFLTGMQLEVNDAETQIGQWAYRFHARRGRTA